MYYITRKIEGDVIRVYKHYNKNAPNPDRGQREKATPEEIEKINQINAEKKLTGLLNANFEEGDSHVVLTYKKETRPPIELARKISKMFLQNLRRVYRQNGCILKYVFVTEYENKAIHHHIVVNDLKGANVLREIQKLWKGYGGTKITALYGMDFEGLAKYLIKETSKTFRKKDGRQRQRWSCSRNLKKPITFEEVSKAARWLKEPKAPKGYFIPKSSIHNGIDWNGKPYQTYKLIRISSKAPPDYLDREEKKRWYKKLLQVEPDNKEAREWLEYEDCV
jgi:hypothetical protein|nr:MAG TPA: protein of unknown function DUF1424 [Caudoviricetes sp.]